MNFVQTDHVWPLLNFINDLRPFLQTCRGHHHTCNRKWFGNLGTATELVPVNLLPLAAPCIYRASFPSSIARSYLWMAFHKEICLANFPSVNTILGLLAKVRYIAGICEAGKQYREYSSLAAWTWLKMADVSNVGSCYSVLPSSMTSMTLCCFSSIHVSCLLRI